MVKQQYKLAVIGSAVGLVAIAALAAHTFATAEDRAPAEASPSAPFFEAAESMREAAGIRVEGHGYDVRISRDGDAVGTLGATEMVRTDGVTYNRLVSHDVTDLLPFAMSFPPSARPTSAWARIGPEEVKVLRHDYMLPDSPQALADHVLQILREPSTNFVPDPFDDDDFADLYTSAPLPPGARNTQVLLYGEVPAYMANTSVGRVYVSKAEPHRLLNLPAELIGSLPSPTGSKTAGSSSSGDPAGQAMSSDNVAPVAYQEPDPLVLHDARPVASFEVSQRSAQDMAMAVANLAVIAKKLTYVMDPRIDLVVEEPETSCTVRACTHRVEVLAQPSETSTEEPTSVPVTVKASFWFPDTRWNGTCTSTTTVRLGEPQFLSCSTGKTADAVRAELARSKKESKQLGARINPYYRSSGTAFAVSNPDLKQIAVTLKQREKDLAAQ
ncbi:hypothetical protein [Kineosporia babensis]|uniref:Uncharacterized protein n=1 Tax=Kineosporia babensis TaxID=499548 RepID=A0A9X1NHE9_9ACTN|nr:hypothetical protein [Kineosporia babensis]MCD5315137.1 hypothetical protein [Kineosporia babensis]